MKPSEILKFNRPLWKHQDATVAWAFDKPNVALLHEMGTGKTTTAIARLRMLYYQRGDVLLTLVVSPVATLENWQEEFIRNSPPRVSDQVVILKGSVERRIKILKESDAKIFITNLESFDKEPFVKACNEKKFFALVLDESHRLKDPKGKRLGRVLYTSDFCQHRTLLTGTHILNNYLDLWTQWRILDKGDTFGLNFYVFREKYFRDENIAWRGKPKYFPSYVPKPGIEEEITQLMDLKASRIKKNECLNLPPLLRMKEYVELSAMQRTAYNEMRDELITYVNSDACIATNALTRILRMLQILSGYVQVEDGRHKISDNPRLARLLELLEELTPNHKVIVWCVFKENYHQISKELESRNIGFASLTGETKDRAEEIRRFQTDPLCRVMISNPQAGGVGVNLTSASYSIYFSRNFSLGDRLQSEARNHRGGSEIHEKITLLDLVAKDTLDEELLQSLERKEKFSENILAKLKSQC